MIGPLLVDDQSIMDELEIAELLKTQYEGVFSVPRITPKAQTTDLRPENRLTDIIITEDLVKDAVNSLSLSRLLQVQLESPLPAINGVASLSPSG